jgi:hypothetical protein
MIKESERHSVDRKKRAPTDAHRSLSILICCSNIDAPLDNVYYTHHMNSREIIKKLQDDGWQLHHTKGDHH